MAAKVSGSFAKLIFASLAMASVAGCAIQQAPVVTQSAAIPSAISDIEMAHEADTSGLRSQFSNSLLQAFSSQSVQSKAGSRWVVDFAIASQPAKTSVVPVGQEDAGVGPSAPGGDAKWYHACKPERVKGTLAVFDREANALAGKSEGHFIACPGDRTEIDKLAMMLVRSVTGKTTSPALQE